MRLPKTLLLTSTRPGTGSVGELFLLPLCRLFAPDRLVVYAGTSNYDVPKPADDLYWLKIVSRPLPAEWPHQERGSNALRKARSFVRLPVLKSKLAPYIEDAVQLGREEEVELIWAVLNSPSMILMAKQVAQLLGVPLLTMVWDPPESTCRQNGMDRISQKLLRLEFDRVLNASSACAAASEGMKQLFEQKYEVPSRVLICPPDAPSATQKAAASRASADQLVITYAGNIYARDAFSALIQALASASFRIAGREVVLRILGNVFNLEVETHGLPARIEFLGHRPPAETMEIVGSSDIAYLPYWFDARFEDAVKQCFPSKLGTYFQSGCPVLYHGPAHSSPQMLIENFGAGVCVNTTGRAEILRAIEKIATEKELRNGLIAGGQQALKEELNHKVFIDRFKELIALSVNSSRPMNEKEKVQAR